MAFIQGDRVDLAVLDPENEAHVEAFRRSRTDRAMRETGHYGSTMTANSASERIAEMQDVTEPNALCAIVADEGVVGWAGTRLSDQRARIGSLGYYVLPSAQGNGYASEAASLLTAYSFEELNAHKVEASVQADNVPSERVLEKLGFRQEGVRRDHFYKDGEYKDVTLWGVVYPEFEPL